MTDNINFFKYFNGKTFDIHVLQDFRIIRPGEFQELLQEMARLFGVKKETIGFMDLSEDAFKLLCKHVQLVKNPVVRTTVRQLKLFDPPADFALLKAMVFPMRLKQMQLNPLGVKVVGDTADLLNRLSRTTGAREHIDVCTGVITDSLQHMRLAQEQKEKKPFAQNAVRPYYQIRRSFQSLMKGIPEFYFFKDYMDLLQVTRLLEPERAAVVDRLVKAYEHCFQTGAAPLSVREVNPKVLMLTRLAEQAIFYHPHLSETTRTALFNRYPDIIRHTKDVLYWNTLSGDEMIRKISDNYEKE